MPQKVDTVWFMALSLLPTVAPFFTLFAEFALCFTGDLKKTKQAKLGKSEEELHVSGASAFLA